jgi:hypothetical protein
MSAYLLICGDIYWRTTFSFLDFIAENVMLVAVLMHTCKRELSPTHLVCPRRHNV